MKVECTLDSTSSCAVKYIWCFCVLRIQLKMYSETETIVYTRLFPKHAKQEKPWVIIKFEVLPN